ncbi:MAG: N-acetylmuramoyl-L-alanine amidase [Terracidiphilus sp.]|nr:N-acetylmuramoyl-L-alanine amidase [Terracidiphilus sp.]
MVAAVAAGLLLAAVPLSAQAPTAPGAQAARFVVVLDAAHGGDEVGAALGAGQNAQQNQTEKAFTLAFAGRLRALLTARGITVVLTRDNDTAVDAGRRAEVANRARAQACVSLHASMSGNGIHLYASSLTPAEATRLAAWKTAQAAYVTRSLKLAGDLNAALAHAGVPVSIGRTALVGMDSMACPAVAVELAPLAAAGQTKASAVTDAAYQARVAQALAAALVEWRAEGQQP